MNRFAVVTVLAAMLLADAAGRAHAQIAPPVLRSVPAGEAAPGTVTLTLADAIDRGLRANLAVVFATADEQASQATRWRTLAGVLPSVAGALSEARERINLESFGFAPPGGEKIIGPFNVFDARVTLAQPVFDLSAILRAQAGAAGVTAAASGTRNARDLVVQACITLYAQAVAARARIDAVRAQLETAQALATQAADLNTAGIVPGIDRLRAEVQADAARQRLIVATNDYARRKLDLARAIGLPLGQAFEPADDLGFREVGTMDDADALATAAQSRPDLGSALTRLHAVELEAQAASAERLPAFDLRAAYGTQGATASGAIPVYSVAAAVRMPVFDGGRIKGRVLDAGASLRRQQAAVGDLRGQVDYDVRTALLDVRAAEQRVRVAQRTVDLAERQLTQARDRFTAGVANTVEVVQAQEAVASASDTYIASLFAHHAAKAALVRALGVGDAGLDRFFGMSRP